VRVFSWSEVPDDLLRALLATARRKFGRTTDGANLDRWTRDQLVAAAHKVFGARPPLALERPFVAVLVDVWLPRLSADDPALLRLAQLANGTQPAAKRLRSVPAARAARLRLIHEGLGRKAVKTAVRKEFMRAHQREGAVRPVQAAPRETSFPVDLRGEAKALLRPYDHQKEAWSALDRVFAGDGSARRGAVLVLPTGAGKTVTALDWLFRRMERDESLRVLWIAHQQALVDQTVLEARSIARERPRSFRRRARAIHSAGSEVATLTDAGTSFVAITFQTLASVRKRTLGSYFRRPVFVVVDEAHHAGAATYDEALERLAGYPTCQGMLGLSATPQPVQPAAALAVRRRFPERAHEVTLQELIERGILARPRFHTVRTHQRVELGADEREALRTQREIPGEMLLFLASNDERNRIVVDEYVRSPDLWGKTIVFCVDIAMADAIAADLRERGVAHVRALHSQLDRTGVLEWFREARGNAVLVAVSMLNEGVDLPDAKTAFLARPTKNRILLKQMVGRVLRGTPAGGSAEAHVVDFRDDWPSLARILGPETAIDGPGAAATAPRPGEDGVLPPEFVAALELVFQPAWGDAPDEDAPAPLLEVSRLTNLALAGYYLLDDPEYRIVPILEHQREAYAAFAERASETQRMRSLEFFFRELPEPRPPYEHLQALRRALLAEAAEYHSVELSVGAAAAVERIRAEGLTGDDRLGVIQEVHETTPVHLAEPSLDRFRDQVLELVDADGSWRDKPLPAPAPELGPIELLDPRERDLRPVLERVARQGRELLTGEVRERLGSPPDIDIGWTSRVIRWAYGDHSFNRKTGRQFIRINRLLCAPEHVVSAELLEFLVWHELLHHVLLAQGHDAQFMALEQAWPNAAELDGELATFHERYASV
jgi:superfamily II DNA or RNA helicase